MDGQGDFLTTIINLEVWINGYIDGCLLLNHAKTAERIWIKYGTEVYYILEYNTGCFLSQENVYIPQ